MGIANEDETKLNVTGYVRVTNESGEVYDNAQTRLVVGKINLVEKIADLARRPPPGRTERGDTGRDLRLRGLYCAERTTTWDDAMMAGDEAR